MKPAYRKMLEGMQKKARKQPLKNAEKWFVYMLTCCDQSLYTGITNDIERRFRAHSLGKGARYTRTRLPLKLVYEETCKSRTHAMVRECALKALPRKKKLTIVEDYQKASSKKARRKKVKV